MKRSRRLRLALVSIVLLLAAPGCDETTKVVSNPMDPTLEPGLDHALVGTVTPVVSGLRTLDDLLTGVSAGVCPDTSGWCGEGWATCTSESDFMILTFEGCWVAEAGAPLLDGSVAVQPGGPMLFLMYMSLRVNGSAVISGEGSLYPAECTLAGSYYTNSGAVILDLKQCDSDPYPTADYLLIDFSYYQASGNFNSSKAIPMIVMEGGEHVANCTIDLETRKSSCKRL